MPVPILYAAGAVGVAALSGWAYGSSNEKAEAPTPTQQFTTIAFAIGLAVVALLVLRAWAKKGG